MLKQEPDALDKLTYAMPEDPLHKKVVIRSIERLTGQRRLERLYQQLIEERRRRNISFWEGALRRLEIEVDYDLDQLAKIPQNGPVIFVANHPYGVLDGLIICYLAAISRGDFKILINSALCRVEELNKYLLPIDFSETKEAALVNIDSKRDALATLEAGGTIVIFPAGGISTADGAFGKVTDLEWKLFTAKMIQKSKATVVPIFFHGQNSRLFQIASQFSLTLRLSLIIREVNRKIGETIQVSIGDPIPFQTLRTIRKRTDLINFLRDAVYALDHEDPPRKRRLRLPRPRIPSRTKLLAPSRPDDKRSSENRFLPY